MKVGLVLLSVSDSRSVGEIARIAASFDQVELKFVGPRVDFDQKCFEFADSGSQKLTDAKTYESWSDFCASETDSIRVAFNGGHGLRYPELQSDLALPLEAICSRITSVMNEGPAHLNSFDLIFSGPQQETKFNSDQLCVFINEWQWVLSSAHFICAPPQLPLSLQAFLALSKVLEIPTQQDPTFQPVQNDDVKDLRFPEEKIQEWLGALGIDVHRGNAYSSLKRLLTGRLASQDELRVLSAIIQQTVRKLT